MSFTGCLGLNFVNKGGDSRQSAGSRSYTEKSMQEYHDDGLWVSGPVNGKFIIIGVSGKYTKPADEIEAAKLDAARKAAMYHGIQGSFELINTTGSRGYFDFSADTKLDLNYDNNYGNYTERLSFNPETDVIRGNGATFVRFRYNISGSDFNHYPVKNSGRPSWVNNRNLPQFAGYTTAVGYAGKRLKLKDTISASYDSAAARLIETASTQMSTKEASASVNRSTSVYTTTHVRSEGRLMNFQVLEFWIDPETGGVSSLAIARVSK